MPRASSPRPSGQQARPPWRRRLVRLAAILLLGPLATILVLRVVPVPATPLMVIRLFQGHGWQHDWMPRQGIAPALAAAVIASEDNRFCEEWFGFDIAALRGQVEAWADGDRPRGASTITMQTAKNLFLWPGRDPLRKVIEAWLTPQIALLWPKRRVLEVYLNIVEFGPGIYGAEAAARHFFDKPASRLSPREAALLAAVLPNPLGWSAGAPGPYVRRRAATIERRVRDIRPLLSCAWQGAERH